MSEVRLDALIFGGGALGLWLLDELARRGRRVLLLEAADLGDGQTIASQGIIHGGLKYSLAGMLTPAARAVRDMPLRWRRSLAAEAPPDLRRVRLRSPFCHLWAPPTLTGRIGMLGARIGLRVAPVPLEPAACPEVLAAVNGTVYRVDEQVLDPVSLLNALADRHPTRVLRIDAEHGLEIDAPEPGCVRAVRLINPDTGDPAELRPERVVLCAGAGNERLRRQAGLDAGIMQRRPLHMVVARGGLPVLNGHCVDRTTTRVTITSTEHSEGQPLWQIGGQVAEAGAELSRPEVVERARAALRECLPGLDLEGVAWTSYVADRAEARTARAARPDRPHVSVEGRTITAWPTKLALVPATADEIVIAGGFGPAAQPDEEAPEPLTAWPRPVVALPPWERIDRWIFE